MPETITSRARVPAAKHEPTRTRLEKKRETDRESQRAVRNRTKGYISHLENLVGILQEKEKDERMEGLIRQCQSLHEENELLRNVITSVNKITRCIEPVPNQTTTKDSLLNQESDIQGVVGKDALPFADQPRILSHEHHNRAKGSLVAKFASLLPSIEPLRPTNELSAPDCQAAQPFPFQPFVSQGKPEESVATSDNDIQVFELINNVITAAENMPITSMELERDVDISIRVVAYEWPEVEKSYTLDPLWQVLRHIDEQVFFCCGPVERLAILRVLRLKLLQHVADSDKQQLQSLLPSFMISRPVQKFTDHPSLIDYFVWPELREFLILNAKSGRPSNKQAAIFASSIRFLWPFELRDTWTRDINTGLHSFSDLFLKRFQDIRCWTLCSEFFELCPQLVGYIPMYDAGLSNTVDKIAPEKTSSQ